MQRSASNGKTAISPFFLDFNELYQSINITDVPERAVPEKKVEAPEAVTEETVEETAAAVEAE